MLLISWSKQNVSVGKIKLKTMIVSIFINSFLEKLVVFIKSMKIINISY